MTTLITKTGHRKVTRAVNTASPFTWSDVSLTTNDTWRYEKSATRHSPRGRWRPPLPYSIVIEEGDNKIVNCDGSYVQWNGSSVDKTVRTGCVVDTSYYTPLPARPAQLQNYAVTKALERLKAQDVNYAQAIGERAQTARLMGDTCRRLVKVVKACHRMDLQSAILALNVGGIAPRKPRRRRRNRMKPTTPFDMWLELQYGWKPMLSDFYATLDAFALRESRADRLTAHVTGKSMSSESFSQTKRLADGANYVDVTKSCYVDHKVFVRLDYVKNDNVPLAADVLSKYGISNPLTLAWELTPWSFVADWFVPIGSYLNTLDATFGWTFKGGSQSMKSTMRTRATKAVPISSYAPWPCDGSLSTSSSSRSMSFERIVFSSSPTPDLPLYIKDRPSVEHALNGIALLAGAIAGGTRVK